MRSLRLMRRLPRLRLLMRRMPRSPPPYQAVDSAVRSGGESAKCRCRSGGGDDAASRSDSGKL